MSYQPDLQRFAARDGTFDPEKSSHYRICFRGEHRRIVDLSFEELRAALLDAHCDLNIAYLKVCALNANCEFAMRETPVNANRDFQRIEELGLNIERVVERHRTPREVEEELNSKE